MPVADSTLSAPSSVDWSYFLSDAAKRYTPSAIRGSFDLLDTPGILSLLAGEPDPASFPFDHLEFSVKPIDPDGKSEVVKLSGKELEDGLQYGGESTLGPWSASLTLGRDAPAPPERVADSSGFILPPRRLGRVPGPDPVVQDAPVGSAQARD